MSKLITRNDISGQSTLHVEYLDSTSIQTNTVNTEDLNVTGSLDVKNITCDTLDAETITSTSSITTSSLTTQSINIGRAGIGEEELKTFQDIYQERNSLAYVVSPQNIENGALYITLSVKQTNESTGETEEKRVTVPTLDGIIDKVLNAIGTINNSYDDVLTLQSNNGTYITVKKNGSAEDRTTYDLITVDGVSSYVTKTLQEKKQELTNTLASDAGVLKYISKSGPNKIHVCKYGQENQSFEIPLFSYIDSAVNTKIANHLQQNRVLELRGFDTKTQAMKVGLSGRDETLTTLMTESALVNMMKRDRKEWAKLLASILCCGDMDETGGSNTKDTLEEPPVGSMVFLHVSLKYDNVSQYTTLKTIDGEEYLVLNKNTCVIYRAFMNRSYDEDKGKRFYYEYKKDQLKGTYSPISSYLGKHYGENFSTLFLAIRVQ